MKKLIVLMLLLLAIPVYGADTKGSALTDGSGAISGTDYVLGYTTTGPSSRRYTVNSILGLKTSVTGNAGTATALAADPAGCAGGQVSTDINASGVAVCTSWAANTLSLLGAADYAAMRTALGLIIGTNVQAYNSNLTAINQALTNTSNPTFSTLNLVGAGLTVGTGSTTNGLLQIKNSTNNNIFTIQPGVTGTALSWILPTAAPGGANYLLNVDADGTMGYTDPAGLGGGYTNLTSFVTQTPWRLFYSNTAGDVTELALGADGTYLRSNGASAAPTFDTPAGSVSDTAYDATTWDAVTTTAPSKNAIRDYLETKLPSGADGSYGITLTNNTAKSPTAATDEMYFEANVLKVNQNGTEYSAALSPTGTQINFSGTLTNNYLCTFATGGAISCNTNPASFEPDITFGTNVLTALGVNIGSAGAPVLFNGAGGVPSSLNLTNAVVNSGTSLPGTCMVGNLFLDTDADTNGQLYNCIATNTWKDVDDDGGAGGMASTDIDTSAELRTIVTDESGAGALLFAGAAQVLPDPVCVVIPGAVTTDDLPIWKAPAAVTITASSIHVYAIGGTNVVGGLDECTGTNGVCSSVTAVDADITGTAGSDVADDGTLTNPTIASGNWVQWHTTSVSGTNTSLSVCFRYTLD
jgi:hypothetical protein